MDISTVDRSATRGDGPLRGASPASKLAAFSLVLAATLVSWNVLMLAAVIVALTAALVWGRVDLRLAWSLAAYPALFALVFAFASAPDAMTAAVIVAKAVTAALAAVSVVLSTPYPQVFSPVQRVTPGIVGDALLLTYRMTFILLEKFGNLLRAVRLRAGVRGRHPARTVRLTASALGNLLIYSIDLAQRDYDIMRLRGYEGRLRVMTRRSCDRRVDAALVTCAATLALLSVLWRAEAATLNPYSWIVPLGAFALLAAAVWTRRSRP